MEDNKISLLPSASNINGLKDLLVIVNENETRKITVNTLFAEASALKGSIRLQGDWNASTNTPDLSSISPIESGFAWRISVDGNTNIAGINDWSVGDLVVKTDNSWIKIGSKDIGAVWGNISGNISNQVDLKGIIDSKLNKNSAIVGSTKTKITFDSNGLIVEGSDANTDDIPEGSKNLYYTDARVIAIGDDRYDTKGQLDSLHNLGLLQGNIDDLGETWTKIPVDVSHIDEFQAVYHVCSLGNGVILAGSYGGNDYHLKVYRSIDYGKTFPETFTVDSTSGHTTFQLLSLGNGIVLCSAGHLTGEGKIYRSTDSGETWQHITIDDNLEFTLCFCNLGNGIVLCGTGASVGDGCVWKSTDYGLSWTKIIINNGLSVVRSISYLGHKTVICAVDNYLYKSTNAGDSWTLIHTTNDTINTTAYLGNGIIVFGTESGNLFRSADYGVTWIIKSASTSIRYITYIGCGVTFYTSSGAAGAKQAKLFKSKDNGSTWVEIQTPFSGEIDYALRMCYVGNSLILLGVGDSSSGKAAIYRSCLIEPTNTNSVTNASLNKEITDRIAADSNIQQQINSINIPYFANGLTNDAGIVKLGGALTIDTAILGGGFGGKTLSIGNDSDPLLALNIRTNNNIELKTGSNITLNGDRNVIVKTNDTFNAVEVDDFGTRIKASESTFIQLSNNESRIFANSDNYLMLFNNGLVINTNVNSKSARILSNESGITHVFGNDNAIVQTDDKTIYHVINEYSEDLSAIYTDRTIVDKGYVTSAINAGISANDAMIYKGVIDASTNPNYPAANAGHFYKISIAGKIGGSNGVNVEIGDSLLCTTDNTVSGSQATVGIYWNIIQTNIDGAIVSPDTISTIDNLVIEAGTTGKTIKDSGISKSSVQTTIINSHTHSNKSTLDAINQGVSTSDSPSFVGITDLGLTPSQIVQTDANKKLQSVAPATAYNQAFETNPSNIKMDGAVSVGISNNISRADHIHPSDTSKVDKINNGSDFANRQTTINNLTNSISAQNYQVLKSISNVAQFVDNKIEIARFSIVSGKQCWNQDYLWSGYSYQESIRSGNDNGWNNSANSSYANPEMVIANAIIKEINIRISRACVNASTIASTVNLNLNLVKMKSDGYISKTSISVPITTTTNIMLNNSMSNVYADLNISLSGLNITANKGDLIALQFNGGVGGNNNISAMDGVKVSLVGIITE